MFHADKYCIESVCLRRRLHSLPRLNIWETKSHSFRQLVWSFPAVLFNKDSIFLLTLKQIVLNIYLI